MSSDARQIFASIMSVHGLDTMSCSGITEAASYLVHGLLLHLWITHAFALTISFPQASVSVGASVNYTWATSGQNKTDAALSFFAVKARLNGTIAHSGTYELVQIPDPHDSDHTGEVTMPFPPPLQDGLYVLDAIIADPTNAKTGLLILASTNTFRIVNTDSSNQSPSSTITNQSASNTIMTLPRGHSRTAIIAGSVCGGVVLLLLLIGGLVVLARRRRRRSTSISRDFFFREKAGF
ncbi:hypothetical protein C8J56DRAFT_893910 [Mycena floridula]|nr:hypothetical protein C8J56DRAFT_893910 [Mycena floridula]